MYRNANVDLDDPILQTIPNRTNIQIFNGGNVLHLEETREFERRI